jgi:hypothetical protein
MAKEDIPEPVRELELSPGMAIWKVHLDSLRERDVNAQVLEDEKFRRLTQNIKKGGELESLPLTTPVPGRNEFYIISGHHRVRAARFAGVMIIHVIVIERELTEDEITAKQLAHNALTGYSDPDVLKALYDSIRDIDARLESGLTELETKLELPTPPASSMDFEFSYEPVYILFLAKQQQAFEGMLDRLEQGVPIYAADKDDFGAYVKMVQAVSKAAGVRNIAGIMKEIVRIVDQHYNPPKVRRDR